jgi:Restriction Endonuclease associating with ARP
VWFDHAISGELLAAVQIDVKASKLATLTPTLWWDQPLARPAAARFGKSIVELRKLFAHERARDLASRTGGPTKPFVPADHHALSKRMVFFADDNVVSVIVGPQENQRDVDRALAYGLAHACDQDLHLIVPADKARPTLVRSPWMEIPVRVWTYDDNACAEQVLPTQDEVLASYSDELETHRHLLGERAAWVEALIRWADADPDLQPAHRKSYLAWHCRGMGVLKIARTKKGLRITAGINYTKPTEEQHPAFVSDLGSEASPVLVHRVISKTASSMADRLESPGVGYQEHLLQGLLIGRPRDLGLVAMERESPAYRPVHQRAFIDFLGIDASGRIHVVETKIGNDEMLVLQGLDYWIWAMAHAESLAAHFGLPGTPEVMIDYVVAEATPGQAVAGPYTAAQAEALVGSIPWRFHEVTDWHGPEPVVASLARRQVPNAPRYTSPRYAIALGEHLVRGAGVALKQKVFYDDPLDGLLPAARAAYAHLKTRELLHPFIGHVRSSQAFALNLFTPLSAEDVVGLLRSLGLDIQHAHAPTFEYSDPEDRLGEHTTERPHATQVDVVLRGFDRAGSTFVALVEVKLSEIDFGPCSAYRAAQNPDRHICRQDGPFGDNPDLCFQLSNWGGSTRRRYDTYIGSMNSTSARPGCLFRLGMNQPMRNVALARALVQAGEAEHVVYALCAPEKNRPIWRRWNEAEQFFSEIPGVTLARLLPSRVLEHHDDANAETLVNRYQLSPES